MNRRTINISNPSVLPSYGVLGNRKYALTNHLNNVLTVISDVVYPLSEDGSTVSGYEVGISSVTDYSPFGVELDGRSFDSFETRYGFNGMEKDDEVKGANNSYTTQFRQYDPRVGRWLSIDPKKKAWESPYVGYSDNPIWFSDPSGADTINYTKAMKSSRSSTASNDLLTISSAYKSFISQLQGKYKDVDVHFKAEKLPDNIYGKTTVWYKDAPVDINNLPRKAQLSDFSIHVKINSVYRSPNQRADIKASRTVTLTHEIALHVKSMLNLLYKNTNGGIVDTSPLIDYLSHPFGQSGDHRKLAFGSPTLYNKVKLQMLNYYKNGTLSPTDSRFYKSTPKELYNLSTFHGQFPFKFSYWDLLKTNYDTDKADAKMNFLDIK